MVGLFIRTMPLRIKLTRYEVIAEIVKKVQFDLLHIEEHMFVEQRYLNELVPNIDKIYRTILTVQNYPVEIENTETYSLHFLSSYYEPIVEISASIKLFMEYKTLEVAYDC